MIHVPPNFSAANAALQKAPVFLIIIAGYSRVFTNKPTGVTGQYEWIESLGDLSITVNDLEGGATIGGHSFVVQDRGGAITGDFPTFTFEGKSLTLTTGFDGMSQSDFALLFTGVIDTVQSVNGNMSYQFNCIENTQVLTKVIYTVGDDGRPTSKDHMRTLNGHPLDIFIAALTTEVGIAATAINESKIIGYRDGIFAGQQFQFQIDSPPAAKDFLEQQIMKPLGGYMWTNNRGQIDVNFFYHNSRQSLFAGCLIAAWADSSGQLVAAPFAPGLGITVTAPAGATRLQLGVNDTYWGDNDGNWIMSVNGANANVGCNNAPWLFTGGINSAYPFSTGGDISAFGPTVVSVTAGTRYSIEYVSGLVSIHLTDFYRDPTGLEPQYATITPPAPSTYVVQPLVGVSSEFSINNDNLTGVPLANQAALVNTISFRFDKDATGSSTSSSSYLAESVQQYSPSIALYGQFGQQIVESEGMRSALQGFFLAASTARAIFMRYGMKNLLFDEVDLLWSACVLEPGDIVDLTSSFVPDRAAGVMGISGRLLEVLDRTWDFTNGIVKLKLLDATYLAKLGLYLITPNGEASFTAASAADKSQFMFMCNDSDQYSDSTPAHVLG